MNWREGCGCYAGGRGRRECCRGTISSRAVLCQFRYFRQKSASRDVFEGSWLFQTEQLQCPIVSLRSESKFRLDSHVQFEGYYSQDEFLRSSLR
jgi:hypothetical protein